MPSNTPDFKKKSVLKYTNNIIECEPNLNSREQTTKTVMKEKNLFFLHPSNNMDVILGNSSCACEFIEDYPKLDFIFSPIGGGGLIAGTSIAIDSYSDKF